MKIIEESFTRSFLRLVVKEARNQGLTHSLDTQKHFSVKIVPQVVI